MQDKSCLASFGALLELGPMTENRIEISNDFETSWKKFPMNMNSCSPPNAQHDLIW